ncbi:hypothetical protein D3C85_1352160 [compost metagenome]
MRANGFCCTLQRQRELLAKLAHPADLPGRHADHERIGRHVLVDHGASADKGVFAHGVAADDGAIGPQRRAALHEGAAVFVLARDGRAWVVDIGEDHARPAEHIVFQGHRVIDADVVLDLDVVADGHVVADVDVLAQRAVFADRRLCADVHPVPDAGAVADAGALVDDRGGVGFVCHAEFAVR